MKKNTVHSYFKQVMASRRISKGVLLTHLYLLVVAMMINSLLYLGVTRPSFSEFYSSSVLSVPTEKSEHLEVIQGSSFVEGEVEDLTKKIQELEMELTELSEKDEVLVPQQIIVKEVIKVIERDVATNHTSGVQPVDAPQQINESGAMIVESKDCKSGYLSVTPRLVKNCVPE